MNTTKEQDLELDQDLADGSQRAAILDAEEPDDATARDAELDALLDTQMSMRDELDDLLADSLAIREEEAATKGLREKLKRGGMSSEERAETEAKVREWEARREWDTIANLAVFEQHTCASCGTVHRFFSHLMHMQEHREKPITRCVANSAQLTSLPNLVAVQKKQTPVCQVCAEVQGWDLSKEAIQWQL